MTLASETEQVRLAASGDRAAFAHLAERSRLWLFGLCFRLVRDRGTAEDLVQETLLRAFRDLAQLRDPDRFRAWLSRIALNICRMHLRRVLARPEEPITLEPTSASGHTDADAPLGVDDALARLDPATRRLLMLCYGDGLSHAELGEMLALSPAAVKSRLHRGRQRLRREIMTMMSDQQKARLGIAEEAPWALRTILLVQPDQALRESLNTALTGAGYQVVTLATGEAALAAVGERRGQLLILDKHCGEPNWVEVLTLVQADAWSRENVPVGVLIDPRSERDVTLAWQAGAMLCLTRPPAPEEVVRFVRQLEQLWPDQRKPQQPG